MGKNMKFGGMEIKNSDDLVIGQLYCLERAGKRTINRRDGSIEVVKLVEAVAQEDDDDQSDCVAMIWVGGDRQGRRKVVSA